MLVFVLGFAVVLEEFLPFGVEILSFLLQPLEAAVFGNDVPSYVRTLPSLGNVVLTIVLVSMFLKKTDLMARLPDEVPGKKKMLIGLSVFALANALWGIAFAMSPGEMAFLVSSLLKILVKPAELLIFYGAVEVLLSVRPRAR